ncbi:MAG: NAD(P)-dependent oxidoreductase [Bacillota bacterium]
MNFTLTQQQDFETIANDAKIPWEKLKQKKILVTGATGMIGKHILLALSRANEIHELEMHLIGSGRNTPLADSLYEATAVEFIEGDILDLLPPPEEKKEEEPKEDSSDKNAKGTWKDKLGKKSKAPEESEAVETDPDEIAEPDEIPEEEVEENEFKKLWAYETVDFIIHCAGVIPTTNMANFPVNTIANIVNGTQNILAFAKEKQCQGFVYISSADIYGEKIEGEVTETEIGTLDLANVRTAYAESKRVAELLTMSYGLQYKLPVFVARLPLTFDSEAVQNESNELHKFFRDIINGGNVELRDAGKMMVNCAYITDVVRGILFVLTKAVPQEVYNLGTQKNACTVKEFAEIVAKVMSDKKAYVVTKKKPADNRFGKELDCQFILNSDRLQWLGYAVEYSLEEMIARIQKATLKK